MNISFSNIILNEVVISGDNKLLNSIFLKLTKGKSFTPVNITNLFPLPNEIKKLEKLDKIDITTQINLYNKFGVTSYNEWVEQNWGEKEFGNIEKVQILNDKLKISFNTDLFDSKLILLNIQRKYPKIIIESLFIDQSIQRVEKFGSFNKDGEVYYKINDCEYEKFINHIELMINELKRQNNDLNILKAA
jgi:hypothetical protein